MIKDGTLKVTGLGWQGNERKIVHCVKEQEILYDQTRAMLQRDVFVKTFKIREKWEFLTWFYISLMIQYTA